MPQHNAQVLQYITRQVKLSINDFLIPTAKLKSSFASLERFLALQKYIPTVPSFKSPTGLYCQDGPLHNAM